MKTLRPRLYPKLFVLTLVLASTSVPAPATAQHGGKAEAQRISFRRGADSASVVGRVRGAEEAEYVVAARAGQEVFITLQTRPPGSVLAKVTDPDGSEVELSRKGTDRWSARLSGDGDYQLVVQKRKPDHVTSRYKITVRID